MEVLRELEKRERTKFPHSNTNPLQRKSGKELRYESALYFEN